MLVWAVGLQTVFSPRFSCNLFNLLPICLNSFLLISSGVPVECITLVPLALHSPLVLASGVRLGDRSLLRPVGFYLIKSPQRCARLIFSWNGQWGDIFVRKISSSFPVEWISLSDIVLCLREHIPPHFLGGGCRHVTVSGKTLPFLFFSCRRFSKLAGGRGWRIPRVGSSRGSPAKCQKCPWIMAS